ncbi:MAG TPA: RidA family protein [Longimicrobiales bacterium]|nr:RidA family protein [Longimicrobiales bacterium]
MTERNLVSTDAPWAATAGYSRAVRVGAHIAVAGTAPVGEDGSIVHPGDAYRQAHRCLAIIRRALAEAGSGVGDVVRTRMFVAAGADWDAVARAHGEVFGNVRPATTLVKVAGFVDDAILVEIEADAIVG